MGLAGDRRDTLSESDMNDMCLVCGSKLDRATGASPGAPTLPIAGDVSICLYCGNVAEFDAAGNIVAISPEEREIVMRLPDVARALQVVAETRKAREH